MIQQESDSRELQDANATPIVETGSFAWPSTGGWVVGQQFLAVRFEVDSPVTSSIVGGHFRFGGSSGSVFAAIVSLSGPLDFPDSFALSTPDLVDATLLEVGYSYPEPSRDFETEFQVTLAPGWYALIFGGAGLFGSTTLALMPGMNPQIGEPSYFSRLAPIHNEECISDPEIECTYDYSWLEGGFTGVRMFLYPVPEPGSMLLFASGLLVLSRCARPRAASRERRDRD